MATFTGKLHSVIANDVEAGSIEVMLCGYGSSVPRANAIALYGRVTTQPGDVAVGGDGTFTGEVIGNDDIAPAGTYYTITVKDSNGDVIQCNAYRFLDDQTYDLDLIDPYDPNQPPPPLPPLITNQLEIVAPSQDMVFHGGIYTAFKTTLPDSISNPTIDVAVPGNLYTFIILQDGTGGHTFAWPGNIHNAAMIALKANSTSVQTFVADENGELWAIGPGTRM